ncbi:MAG: hypothetical protein ABIH52_04295 [Candidatus Aenigmatarchaeota archaeon]
MIIAKWSADSGCWNLKSIPLKGKTPRMYMKDYIVTSKIEDAIKEITLMRKEPICVEDVQKAMKGKNVCYMHV